MTPITTDSQPIAPSGGIYARPAGAALSDYTKVTIDAMFAVTGADELKLLPGMENITTEDAEGDSKTDSFGKKYVLNRTLTGGATSFRINAAGYKELQALVAAGNVDLFFISGSVTETSQTVEVGDQIMCWYSQPLIIAKPAIGETSIDVAISWETTTATGGSDPFKWEPIV